MIRLLSTQSFTRSFLLLLATEPPAWNVYVSDSDGRTMPVQRADHFTLSAVVPALVVLAVTLKSTVWSTCTTRVAPTAPNSPPPESPPVSVVAPT